ncbi:TPA: hypothetical protein HA251_04950 [Candidatus Woesearchaeota archaeon]|nr:hypothetical protein [Candidatus Woesearchaeota archaeon]
MTLREIVHRLRYDARIYSHPMDCWVWGQNNAVFAPSMPRIDGKFCFHDTPSVLENIAQELLPLVNDGTIVGFKYHPRVDEDGEYAGQNPPMLVYTQQAQRTAVESFLNQRGVDHRWIKTDALGFTPK